MVAVRRSPLSHWIQAQGLDALEVDLLAAWLAHQPDPERADLRRGLRLVREAIARRQRS